MTDTTLSLPGLSPVEAKEIHARFDGGALSSDGGVLALREIEHQQGYADMLSRCLHDKRDPSRTLHSYKTMIRARMFAICCGYEDCDDLDELRHDPAMKMACERLPDSGLALASRPTLSRLENAPSWRELARDRAAGCRAQHPCPSPAPSAHGPAPATMNGVAPGEQDGTGKTGSPDRRRGLPDLIRRTGAGVSGHGDIGRQPPDLRTAGRTGARPVARRVFCRWPCRDS